MKKEIRMLAAIMFTDMVGYTVMMQEMVLFILHGQVIHEILERDRQAPKKQRHTAQRIFDRLCREHDYDGRRVKKMKRRRNVFKIKRWGF